MIKQFFTLITLSVFISASAQWKSVGDKIKTVWANKEYVYLFC